MRCVNDRMQTELIEEPSRSKLWLRSRRCQRAFSRSICNTLFLCSMIMGCLCVLHARAAKLVVGNYSLSRALEQARVQELEEAVRAKDAEIAQMKRDLARLRGGFAGGPEVLLSDLMRGNLKAAMHGYHHFYESVLGPLRHTPNLRLLEIGVDRGESMLMWLRYFTQLAPNGVQGLDSCSGLGCSDIRENITKKCTSAKISGCDRLRLFFGDQSDEAFLKHVVAEGAGISMGAITEGETRDWEREGWDIVIDDGSHIPRHQLLSFSVLFPCVRPGGMYVIEDIESSYWDGPRAGIYGMPLPGAGLANPPPGNFVESMKQLIDVMNRGWFFSMNYTVLGSHIDHSIASISFHGGLICVHKRRNDLPVYPIAHFHEPDKRDFVDLAAVERRVSVLHHERDMEVARSEEERERCLLDRHECTAAQFNMLWTRQPSEPFKGNEQARKNEEETQDKEHERHDKNNESLESQDTEHELLPMQQVVVTEEEEVKEAGGREKERGEMQDKSTAGAHKTSEIAPNASEIAEAPGSISEAKASASRRHPERMLVGITVENAVFNTLVFHIRGLSEGAVYLVKISVTRDGDDGESFCVEHAESLRVDGGKAPQEKEEKKERTAGVYLKVPGGTSDMLTVVAEVYDDVVLSAGAFAGRGEGGAGGEQQASEALLSYTSRQVWMQRRRAEGAPPAVQPQEACAREPLEVALAEEGLRERRELYQAHPPSPTRRCQHSLVCQLADEDETVHAQGIKVQRGGARSAGALGAHRDKRAGAHANERAGMVAAAAAEELDTLIIYAFAATEAGSGVWEDNLDFFLAQGLVAHARYRFVVVCNGGVDGAWGAKLDALAAWLPNFEWHVRGNQGRDAGAWSAVLNAQVPLRFDLATIRRFILINASVRGPFLPEYFTRPWPEALFTLLHSPRCKETNCQLAGLLVDCNCLFAGQRPNCTFDCNIPPGPRLSKVPSFLLAFEIELFSLVNYTLFQGDAHYAEVAMSRFVIAQGGNWAVLSSLGRRVDFRDNNYPNFHRLCSEDTEHNIYQNDYPLWGSTHYGLAFHAFEQMFIKLDVNNSNAGLLANSHVDVFTHFALRSTPWTAPWHLICCRHDTAESAGSGGKASAAPSLPTPAAKSVPKAAASSVPASQAPEAGARSPLARERVGEEEGKESEAAAEGVHVAFREGPSVSGLLPPFACCAEAGWGGGAGGEALEACSYRRYAAANRVEGSSPSYARGYAVDSSERSRLRGSEPSLVCQMAAEYESVWAQGTNGSLHAKPFAFWKRAHNHIHTPPLWTDPQTQTRERETAHERERVSGGGERETEERERADTRDTLIVFAFSGKGSSAAAYDNLSFFLAQGLVAHARYRFVVVCNGGVDGAWGAKLDALAAWLPNFEWHVRGNQGRDAGAWSAVLNAQVPLRFDLATIRRFILINASVRGPFLPEYFTRPWPEALFTLLHSPTCPTCQLAGLMVDCNSEIANERCNSNSSTSTSLQYDKATLDGSQYDKAALDGSLLAFSARLFPLARRLLSLELDEREFAYKLSRGVLKRQGNWAVTAAMWKAVDFRDAAAVSRICGQSAVKLSGHWPKEANLYAGTFVHPLELIFTKVWPWIEKTVWRFTRLSLSNLPWTVPLCSLCDCSSTNHFIKHTLPIIS